MADQNIALELLLNKATSPALHEEDWDAIVEFCDQVNRELEGPQIAIRLLAHKIQSPTEREALYALSTIEACVKNCGRTFHQEIGKFRFLNEIIKVVSPKYLGTKTTEKVKKRCIELVYSWYKGLPHEAKIGEAYKMLRQQGIIKEDPTYMDKTFDPFPPPKPRRADFEDEEKAKTLSMLLKSKNPEDLQAANRLIKNMVKEDAEKSERRSRRINELESISNQVKLLTEMVNHYSPSSSSQADKDMMKELYENLEKQRPKLFRLASETEEQDTNAINDILKVNDTVTRAMSLYMDHVKGHSEKNGEVETGVRDSSLLDLGFDSSPRRHVQVKSDASSGLDASAGSSSLSELNDLFTSQPSSHLQSQNQTLLRQASGAVGATGMSLTGLHIPGTAFAGGDQMSAFPAIFPTQSLTPSHQLGNLAPFSGVQTSVMQSNAPVKPSAMAELDVLGQSLLAQNRSKDFVPPPVVQPKLSMNQMAFKTNPTTTPVTTQHQSLPVNSLATPSFLQSASSTSSGMALSTSVNMNNSGVSCADDSLFTPMASASLPPPVQELLPLTDVFVPLESIKPDEDLSPLTAYDKNGVKCMIHFSTNRPRPDVLVTVLSTLNTSTKPIKSFMFQAAVPKIMKVKLQPPSASDLPAFNPILPPAAITQVMLIANPRKEKVRLKFKISYVSNNTTITDVGDAEDFPTQ